jgi:hypothetical protein
VDPGVLGLLQDQDLVDRLLQQPRVVLAQELADPGGIDARALRRRNLPVLELGQRDDLAVDLGHHALDRLGAGRAREREAKSEEYEEPPHDSPSTGP